MPSVSVSLFKLMAVPPQHTKFQQAIGDDAVSTAQAFHWHNMFSESRTFVEDEHFSG
jgi:hypothetical protein